MKLSKKRKDVGGKNYYNKIPLNPNDRFIDWDVEDIFQYFNEDIKIIRQNMS
ncbi:MAG: hypothetical protein LUG60_10345 [Erysipelotrichaceae bacterium]|nr:hypothetical protein [Erysipelotrichaceae bacterium]